MNLIFIMPAHNEERTITHVIKATLPYGPVLVINDASTDRTEAYARDAGATVITHPTNRGLGAALRTGFAYARTTNADAVITIDADGQHEPADIPKFIAALQNGYDFVLGERDLSAYPFVKKFGNFFLNLATNFISRTHLRDTEGGFRAIRMSALKRMHLKAERYEIAVEIIFEVGRNNLRAINVPLASSVYVKGVGVRDGIMNFNYLLHRRQRNLHGYVDDIVYVLRNRF